MVIDNILRRTAKSATSSSSKNVLFVEQRAYLIQQDLCNKNTAAVQCKLAGRRSIPVAHGKPLGKRRPFFCVIASRNT